MADRETGCRAPAPRVGRARSDRHPAAGVVGPGPLCGGQAIHRADPAFSAHADAQRASSSRRDLLSGSRWPGLLHQAPGSGARWSRRCRANISLQGCSALGRWSVAQRDILHHLISLPPGVRSSAPPGPRLFHGSNISLNWVRAKKVVRAADTDFGGGRREATREISVFLMRTWPLA